MIYIVSAFKTCTNTVLASIIFNNSFPTLNTDIVAEDKINLFIRREHTSIDVMTHISELNEDCVVITVVRDPLSLYISAFFQDIDCYPFSVGSPETVLETDNKTLLEAFNSFDFRVSESYNIDILFNMLELTTGFNVYDNDNEPFDKDLGLTSYKFQNKAGYQIKLIVVRQDKLNSVISSLGKELNIKDLQVIQSNVGEEKWYGEKYKQFKSYIKQHIEDVKLMDQFLEQSYVKFFYSDDEVKQMRTLQFI